MINLFKTNTIIRGLFKSCMKKQDTTLSYKDGAGLIVFAIVGYAFWISCIISFFIHLTLFLLKNNS